MTIPRIDPNDPKWTAYVLGELDAADHAAVDRLLETSAEARALVAELRTATIALDDALTTEPDLLLTPAQRSALLRAAEAQSPRWFGLLPARRPTQWAWAVGAATAAALAIAVLPLTPDLPTPPVPERVIARGPGAAAVPAPTANAVPGTPSVPAGDAAQPPVQSTPPRTDSAAPVLPQVPSPTASDAKKEQNASTSVTVPSEAITVTGSTPIVDAQSFAARLRSGLDAFAPAAVPTSPLNASRGGGIGFALGDVGAIRGGFPRPSTSNESYATVGENTFVRAQQEPLATFSIDVDTASYSNVRRFLNQNQLPPADAVRIEELLNYFTYDYAGPSGSQPIGTSMAVTAAPWNPQHRLVRIGVKAREIDARRRPPSNLVFLIDVSGSMNTPQKLPLLKSGLKLLVDQLGENDVVSMVVYAGASGLVLPPTRGDQKDVIARTLDTLEAGGSTNGGAGIQLAYNQATANFIRGGTNRVILMTDGDFNVGITGQGDLTRLIEERAKSGVFLSVLGFGMGNLKDSTMEKLADTGNGHYAYIDSLSEARKVLVEQMSGTLVTVAKDVKIQVDFNPAKVEAYRLIGYENRVLRPEDFNNDLKDAGDMGAGHTVTALFEIVPRGGSVPGASVDPSVFQPATRDAPAPASTSNDMLVLRVRYKLPDASTSTRMDVPLTDRGAGFSTADPDFRFAASVAAFGMILKGSPYRGEATLEWVRDIAAASQGKDRGGYRDEFVSLVQKAIAISARRAPAVGSDR